MFSIISTIRCKYAAARLFTQFLTASPRTVLHPLDRQRRNRRCLSKNNIYKKHSSPPAQRRKAALGGRGIWMMAERLYARIWRQNGFPAQLSSQPAATPCPKGGCGAAALCMAEGSNRFFLKTFILSVPFITWQIFCPNPLFADMRLSGQLQKSGNTESLSSSVRRQGCRTSQNTSKTSLIALPRRSIGHHKKRRKAINPIKARNSVINRIF